MKLNSKLLKGKPSSRRSSKLSTPTLDPQSRARAFFFKEEAEPSHLADDKEESSARKALREEDRLSAIASGSQKSQKEPQTAQAVDSLSVGKNFSNKEEPKLPEILETLNDQEEEDVDEFFHEFEEKELTKFVTNMKKLEESGMKRSSANSSSSQQNSRSQDGFGLQVPIGFGNPNTKAGEEVLERRKSTSLRDVRNLERLGVLIPNPASNTKEEISPIELKKSPSFSDPTKFNMKKLKLPDQPKSPQQVEGAGESPGKNFFLPVKPQSTNSSPAPAGNPRSAKQQAQSNATSNRRIMPENNVSSEVCIGEEEEGLENGPSDSMFKSALEFDDGDNSEMFDVEINLDASKRAGMISYMHNSLTSKGAYLVKSKVNIQYSTEKPRGFNPKFTGGRILLSNNTFLVRIENAVMQANHLGYSSESSNRSPTESSAVNFMLSIENTSPLKIEFLSFSSKCDNNTIIELHEDSYSRQ